ncbi:ribosomal protein L35, putative [Plasmodium ovale]|uniref:50S ribosomal protein L35 n=1 Tax=Plasmodium ovale TaxID=36330 RepID=A0A1D3U7F7_PLAOA|nr:ribosomal protein L35, putative [Plasmodium ovale]
MKIFFCGIMFFFFTRSYFLHARVTIGKTRIDTICPNQTRRNSLRKNKFTHMRMVTRLSGFRKQNWGKLPHQFSPTCAPILAYTDLHIDPYERLYKIPLLWKIAFLRGSLSVCNSSSVRAHGGARNGSGGRWTTPFTLHVRGCTNLKPKTNKSIAKRFKLTKNGKLIRKKAGRSHMLRKKTSSNKASLRKRTTIASPRIAKKYKSVIFK